MARNIMIGYYDWVSRFGGTLSAGSWAAGLPRDNILDPDWRVVAESVDNNPSNTGFQADLNGAERPVDIIHVGGILTDNLSTDTIRVRAYDDAAVELYDSTAVAIWGGSTDNWTTLARSKYFVLPEQEDVRTITVNFAVASGTVKVGAFGAYQAFTPAHNFRFGWSESFPDDSVVERIPGGSQFVTQRSIRRRVELGLPAVASSEIGLLRTIMAENGRQRPYVIVPFPDEAIGTIEKSAIYAMQANEPAFANSFFAHYESAFTFEQM